MGWDWAEEDRRWCGETSDLTEAVTDWFYWPLSRDMNILRPFPWPRGYLKAWQLPDESLSPGHTLCSLPQRALSLR